MEQNPSQSVAPSQNSEETPSGFLGRVRGQTSYGTLRTVITIVFVLLILIAVIPAFVVIGIESNKYSGADTVNILLALTGMVVGIVLAAAFKQFFTMFVDMADTLIEQNRKKTK